MDFLTALPVSMRKETIAVYNQQIGHEANSRNVPRVRARPKPKPKARAKPKAKRSRARTTRPSKNQPKLGFAGRRRSPPERERAGGFYAASEIDPAVLAELPDEIRQQIERDMARRQAPKPRRPVLSRVIKEHVPTELKPPKAEVSVTVEDDEAGEYNFQHHSFEEIRPVFLQWMTTESPTENHGRMIEIYLDDLILRGRLTMVATMMSYLRRQATRNPLWKTVVKSVTATVQARIKTDFHGCLSF